MGGKKRKDTKHRAVRQQKKREKKKRAQARRSRTEAEGPATLPWSTSPRDDAETFVDTIFRDLEEDDDDLDLDLDDDEDLPFLWPPPPARPPFVDPIDWARAAAAGPAHDPLAGGDLADPRFAAQCADRLVHLIASGYYVRWDGVMRTEQGLMVEPFHEEPIEGLDEDDPDIEEPARPCEPWYATFRRLAPALRVERHDTTDATHDALLEACADLLDALAQWTGMIALPEPLLAPCFVLPDGLRRALELQSCLAPLQGLGRTQDGVRAVEAHIARGGSSDAALDVDDLAKARARRRPWAPDFPVFHPLSFFTERNLHRLRSFDD